jgi:hypothetical protein
MEDSSKVRYRVRQDSDSRIVLRDRAYRLNRSRKLDGKPGHYDGRPIKYAARRCPPMRRVA